MYTQSNAVQKQPIVDYWFARKASSADSQIRLFCFPYAGGGASIFREWSHALNVPVELATALLPGREARMGEAPRSDIIELTRELATAIAPLLDSPFMFFGHSMGALLAYTLCQELQCQRLPLPERLIVSAARPPHIPEANPLHHLDDAAFINALRRFSGTPEAILANEELMELFLPMLRADFALEETYKHYPQAALDVPVTAISGTQDQEVSPEEMAQWANHTSCDFEQVVIEGGHFFINDQRNELLAKLNDCIASHLPSSTPR